VINSETTDTGQMLANTTRPSLLPSATTITLRLRAMSARSVAASVSFWVVSPVSASMPFTPMNATSILILARVASARGPTSSYDAPRATPPVTISLMLGRMARSAAMFNALVTTETSGPWASRRPISVVVVPPVRAITAPSGTRRSAAAAIRCFSARAWPPR
jgi:hypothetical protein